MVQQIFRLRGITMYFQFLIEDSSTEILIRHVMEKLKKESSEEVFFDMKSFSGIGHLRTTGNLMERKGSNLLNNLHAYLRGFDRVLSKMEHAAIVVVLDNDKRDTREFRAQLESIASGAVMCTDYVFCIAVKEMDAWLLGDEGAIQTAYPDVKKRYLKEYQHDGLCDTWDTLANAVYPGGLQGLRKKARNKYSEIGKAKSEWAEKIGKEMNLDENKSPSFQQLIFELRSRISVA